MNRPAQFSQHPLFNTLVNIRHNGFGYKKIKLIFLFTNKFMNWKVAMVKK